MKKAVEDPISRALKLSGEKHDSGKPKRYSRAEFSGRPASSSAKLIHSRNEIELDTDLLLENHLLVSPDHDDGVTADRYRLLNTRIQQRMRPRQWTKLGITSPAPREGKSLTSLNLAITASREGSEPVILIDADTRRPTICEYLGAEPKASLVDYLEGSAELEDVVFTSPTYPRLHIIGNVQGRSREALTKNRLDELFRAVGNENTTVLIDLPPVLLADDVLLVAPQTDAMLIVLRDEHSNLTDLKASTDLLGEYNLLGTVLNCGKEINKSMEGYYHVGDGGVVNDV